MSWSFQIRAYGRPGWACGKIEITGRMAPGSRLAAAVPPAMQRCRTIRAKISSGVRARRRSRTTRLRQ
jgi:hypothetical protein